MTQEELKKKIMDAINAADISVVLRRDDIIILADALIAAGMTIHDEQNDSGFASELVNIKNGRFPNISDKKRKGLIFENGGLGGRND